MTVPAIDDAGFAAAVAGPGVVIVLFSAAWCAPCVKAIAETEALAGELSGGRSGPKARVMIADLDAAQDAALAADVRGVPALAVYRGGAWVATLVGQYPRARLRQWFDDVVKG